ncbi:MAG TPA: (d)CMP kinase [Anaerolineales bacterium]|nr:(d)CMP kinase [Anaerolineales bacterium]
MTAKIIAIDGPAASGKSTIGKKLADHFGYLYFDTGVMYRAVTLAALRRGLNLENEIAITRLAEELRIDVSLPSAENGRSYDVLLDSEDVTKKIFQPEIDKNVSVISAYPGVRRALTAQQRRVGLRGEVVMVGRDIGTVVLPEADLKVYLDASVEERARRRYLEYQMHGEPASMEEITKSMRKRDRIDSTREAAPLKLARDAVRINTDGLNIDQVLDRLKLLAEGKDV